MMTASPNVPGQPYTWPSRSSSGQGPWLVVTLLGFASAALALLVVVISTVQYGLPRPAMWRIEFALLVVLAALMVVTGILAVRRTRGIIVVLIVATVLVIAITLLDYFSIRADTPDFPFSEMLPLIHWGRIPTWISWGLPTALSFVAWDLCRILPIAALALAIVAVRQRGVAGPPMPYQQPTQFI